MSELGNLTEGIFLSPPEMSTVKIRAGSLFCTPRSRSGAKGAAFGQAGFSQPGFSRHGFGQLGFPHRSTALWSPAQVVHRASIFETCGNEGSGCKVEEDSFRRKVQAI